MSPERELSSPYLASTTSCSCSLVPIQAKRFQVFSPGFLSDGGKYNASNAVVPNDRMIRYTHTILRHIWHNKRLRSSGSISPPIEVIVDQLFRARMRNGQPSGGVVRCRA